MRPFRRLEKSRCCVFAQSLLLLGTVSARLPLKTSRLQKYSRTLRLAPSRGEREQQIPSLPDLYAIFPLASLRTCFHSSSLLAEFAPLHQGREGYCWSWSLLLSCRRDGEGECTRGCSRKTGCTGRGGQVEEREEKILLRMRNFIGDCAGV